MRSNSAQDSENALHEERWLDDSAIGKVRQSVKMPNVIALDLEASAVRSTLRQNHLDVGEGVLEDSVSGSLEVLAFPLVFEVFEAVKHRIQTEVHRSHVELSDLRLELRCRFKSLINGHRGSPAGG